MTVKSLLLKRILPVSEVKYKREAVEAAIAEIEKICKTLQIGQSGEVDTSRISPHTVRRYVDILRTQKRIADEFYVRTIIEGDRDRCFILHLTPKDLAKYREKYSRKRRPAQALSGEEKAVIERPS